MSFLASHPNLWPGYRVTIDGRVYSLDSNWRRLGVRQLVQVPDAWGYPRVRIMRDGKRVTVSVHRMVAAAFLPPRPSPAHEIRHLDGDPRNNHVSNLAWGTPKENAADRDRHGRTSRGARHSEIMRAASIRSTNPYYRHARQAVPS